MGKRRGLWTGRKHMTGRQESLFDAEDLDSSSGQDQRGGVINDTTDDPPSLSDDNLPPPMTKPESHTMREDDIGRPSCEKPDLRESEGAVGDVDGHPWGRPVGQLSLDTTCEYVRGGNCLVHGPGATRKFRGGHKVVVGRGGIRTKRYTRSYYYVCEHREGGQIQPRLSLVKMTSQNARADDKLNCSTSTAGQNGN